MQTSLPFTTPPPNLLPHDGEACYLGQIFTEAEAAHYLENLLSTIEWRQDEVVIFGKHIITQRKVAWYGDRDYLYTYSHSSKSALPWTPALLELRQKAETLTGATYNSCLLNLYHSGEEGMGWHSDDEKTIEPGSSIASLSFGADRKFSFKHKKSKETLSLLLENGSLLEMKGQTQTHWHHALPKSKKVKEPRINLTFRRMI